MIEGQLAVCPLVPDQAGNVELITGGGCVTESQLRVGGHTAESGDARSDAAVQPRRDSSVKPVRLPAENHRILIVDDNAAIHDDIRKILCGTSSHQHDLANEEMLLFSTTPEPLEMFEIDSAYQGQEGLDLLKRSIDEGRPYALAFVDVRMPPGWDGIETIENLWQVHPALQVVVCTAYSDYSWSDIRQRLGSSDSLLILKKPFDNIEVIQLAYTLTRKWQVSLEASLQMDDLNSLVSQRTEELRTAQEAFQSIFEVSPVGIALLDMDARCLNANAAFASITGLDAKELSGKDPVELGWIPTREMLRELGKQLASFGSVDAKEISYCTAASGSKTGLLWLREVTIHCQPHILSFFLDITDRKNLEEDLRHARTLAESAVRVKSDFLAHMSHEIRTPLNGLVGLSAMLQEREFKSDSHSILRLIQASGETLAKILDDVLDYSKIESGKLELEQSVFSLRECVGWAIDLFTLKATEKHLRLVSTVSPQIPDCLLGDATRVRQVLANLISNAIKFTETGSVEVEADTVTDVAPEGTVRVRIRVRDTGIGIAPEQADRLFRSFSQLETSTNRRYGGTGLGLVISKRLVELMSGRIGVSSEPGMGSVFEFEVPFGLTKPQTLQATLQEARKPLGLRVLVAEDNPVNQIVVEAMLRKLGCEPDLVGDGGAAVEKVKQTPYDVLLLDIQMPNVDGMEAARRIRAAEKSGARLPLIAMTASATLEDRAACMAAGMDDYLTKPLTVEALRRVLARTQTSESNAARSEETL